VPLNQIEIINGGLPGPPTARHKSVTVPYEASTIWLVRKRPLAEPRTGIKNPYRPRPPIKMGQPNSFVADKNADPGPPAALPLKPPAVNRSVCFVAGTERE